MHDITSIGGNETRTSPEHALMIMMVSSIADDGGDETQCRPDVSSATSHTQRWRTGKEMHKKKKPWLTDVNNYRLNFFFFFAFLVCRKCTCTRKHCRVWFILFRAPLRTISNRGRHPPRPIVTNARVFYGALPVRVSGVLNAASNVTRSARICSTPTAYKVSNSSSKMWAECGRLCNR